MPTPTNDNLTTWLTYQKAWSAVSTAERQELLRASLTEDCVYNDPQTQCNGRAELLTYIEAFLKAMPGYTFQNHTFLTHHDQSMAGWVLYDAAGAAHQPGNSYARFTADGHLQHIAGFFEQAPQAG